MPQIDANIFIRFLTNDQPTLAKRCFKLFESASRGEIDLRVCEAVVAEVVYILSSKRLYNLKRSEIVQKLLPILAIKGLRIPAKTVVLDALKIYGTVKIDFEDALQISYLKRWRENNIYSYDHDFDKVGTIKRLEP